MKKLLLYLLLIAGIVACSKDDNDDYVPPTPPATEHLSIVNGTPGLSGNTLTVADPEADSEAELTLAGVTGSVTATVDPLSTQWLAATVESEPVEEDEASAAAETDATEDTLVWKVVVTAKAYTGNEDRAGFVTIESGDDAIQVKVMQGGRGKKIRMVVVNEGRMSTGTAALSAIAYDGTTDYDIFRTVNNKPLGDVGQSITYIDGKYFVALNNSKQVAVVEPQTFKLIETIDYEQDGKPRFIAQINENEAIVSDLHAQLVRIDIKNYKVIGHIDISAAVGVNGGVEKMTVVGKKLFCAVGANKGVGVFDTDGEISGESMRFVEGLQGSIMKTCKMIEDKNGKLWVFATGNGGVQLNRIDPATEKVDKVVSIPYVTNGSEEYVPGAIVGTAFFTRWDTDRTRGKLYFFMNMLVDAKRKASIGAIYTLNVDKDEIDPEPYRELPGLGMMYGMNISPDGDVFVCDCLDYTAQRGFLREYKADGSVDSRRVGVYPRMVHFTEYDNR